MDMAMMIVPEWYRAARQQGKSAEALIEQVRDFCLQAIQRHAARRGEPWPETVDNEFVAMTADTFEFALGGNGN
jgi:hypothetical protein